jgi:hypothetical protein
MSPYQEFTTLLSRLRGQKWIQDLPKPYKYPPQACFKGQTKKRERKKEKSRVITIKKYKARGLRVHNTPLKINRP